MTDRRPRFETEDEAKAFCRDREAEEPQSSWLPFQQDGRWTAVRTNLPRHDAPHGSATEAKSKPPQADDPRTPQQRDAYWGGGGA
ncbi:MAG: hypothetical protein ACRDL3_04040 [Solirubrobacterales bacterium]